MNKTQTERINNIIEGLLKWLISVIIIKNFPDDLTSFKGITTMAITVGFILSMLEIIIPNICDSIKNSILLILVLRILK